MTGIGAIVRAAWTPGRADPAHRAEMTTSWLLGETLVVREESGDWLRVGGEDGYEAWTARGGLLVGVDAAGWRQRATAWSLGVALRSDAPAAPAFAPWGGRLELRDDGSLALPGGETARPAESRRLLGLRALRERYPADPRRTPETALAWSGAPYLWGGRTAAGVDCSGLVQAVFATHGLRLPRDSRDQARAGRDVAESAGPPDPRAAQPGDLLFFAWEGKPVSHVGLALGDGRIVHASTTRGGVAVDDLTGDSAFGRHLASGLVAIRRHEGPERAGTG